MDTNTTLRLVFLSVLLIAIIASVAPFVFRRGSRALQQVGIWVIIFASVTFVFSFADGPWSTHRAQSRVTVSDGQIEIEQFYDGHYYLTAELNGAEVEFVVDTGATEVVLTQADAVAAGLDPENLVYSGTAMTANGETRVAPARINIFKVGDIKDRNIRVLVNEGEMDVSLLGMSYLQTFDSIAISGQKMVLSR